MDRPFGRALNLFTPGPVDILPQARQGLAEPIRYHRSAEFEDILARVNAGLQSVLRTDHEVVTLTSSATGAMEAAVAAVLRRGDRVLVPVNGKFSGRWVDVCKGHGIDVSVLDLAWGESPSPDMIADALRRDDGCEAVLLTHCETSTGALTDIEAVCGTVADIARRLGKHVMTLVDATSSLCVDDLKMDEWGMDCVVAASQKGLLSPPGLALVCLGDRARRALARPGICGYYLDLRRYYDAPSRPPFTPAVGLVASLDNALRVILEAGLDRVVAANRSAAEGLGLVVESAGFTQVARRRSNAVTVFRIDGLDARELARRLADEHGIVVAEGQGELSGRVLRASGIGKGRKAILAFARGLEASLSKMGRSFDVHGIEADLNAILEGSTLWESLRS